MQSMFIGFKGANNSSCRIVRALSAQPVLLTNSFAGVARDIGGIAASAACAYLFGVDTQLTDAVRIECIAEKDGCTRQTALATEPLVQKFAAEGIKASVSRRATHYLCNEAYWLLLEKFGGAAILIHVPPLRYADDTFISRLLGVWDKEQH